MSVTVIPTELDRSGNPVERRDKAKQFPDMESARELLTATVSQLMERAGMTYDLTQTLEQNTETYYQETGHAFGWIIESTHYTEAPPRSMPWLKLTYLLAMSVLLFAAVVFVERALLALGSPEFAAQIATILRTTIGLVLAISLLRIWISRRRQ